MSAVAWIALGSNLGERKINLDGAVTALRELDGVVVEAVSSWHATEPVGGPPGQPQFLNGVLRCTTSLEPQDLLRELQEIEARFGRDRRTGVPNGPRTLDLDLLLVGDLALDEASLTLPHPGLEDRTFVLEPLAELDPTLRLPRSEQTVAERLLALRVNS